MNTLAILSLKPWLTRLPLDLLVLHSQTHLLISREQIHARLLVNGLGERPINVAIECLLLFHHQHIPQLQKSIICLPDWCHLLLILKCHLRNLPIGAADSLNWIWSWYFPAGRELLLFWWLELDGFDTFAVTMLTKLPKLTIPIILRKVFKIECSQGLLDLIIQVRQRWRHLLLLPHFLNFFSELLILQHKRLVLLTLLIQQLLQLPTPLFLLQKTPLQVLDLLLQFPIHLTSLIRVPVAVATLSIQTCLKILSAALKKRGGLFRIVWGVLF